MIGCCSIKLQIYALIPAPTIDELLQVGEEDRGGGGGEVKMVWFNLSLCQYNQLKEAAHSRMHQI